MEEVKIDIKYNVMTIEGEFDIELDIKGIHFGFPIEDENIFSKAAFEIRPYGEVEIKSLPSIVEWINKNCAAKSENVTEWPRWKVTFERL